MCSVFIQETEKVVSISSEHLEPVTPTKNNKVTVALRTSYPACLVSLPVLCLNQWTSYQSEPDGSFSYSHLSVTGRSS